MDLSFLIPSRVRREVLSFFVENPEEQVYVRELARRLKIAPQQIYRELLNLEGWGFLFSSKRGTQRVFRVNDRFPLTDPVKDLFDLTQKENSRPSRIVATYDAEKLSREIRKIPVPPELVSGLTVRRRKPRAYAEQVLLEKNERS